MSNFPIGARLVCQRSDNLIEHGCLTVGAFYTVAHNEGASWIVFVTNNFGRCAGYDVARFKLLESAGVSEESIGAAPEGQTIVWDGVTWVRATKPSLVDWQDIGLMTDWVVQAETEVKKITGIGDLPASGLRPPPEHADKPLHWVEVIADPECREVWQWYDTHWIPMGCSDEEQYLPSHSSLIIYRYLGPAEWRDDLVPYEAHRQLAQDAMDRIAALTEQNGRLINENAALESDVGSLDAATMLFASVENTQAAEISRLRAALKDAEALCQRWYAKAHPDAPPSGRQRHDAAIQRMASR